MRNESLYDHVGYGYGLVYNPRTLFNDLEKHIKKTFKVSEDFEIFYHVYEFEHDKEHELPLEKFISSIDFEKQYNNELTKFQNMFIFYKDKTEDKLYVDVRCFYEGQRQKIVIKYLF